MIRSSVLLVSEVAMLLTVFGASSAPSTGDCKCEYEIPCCNPESVLVECFTIHGVELCPWDWDAFAVNTLTRNDCEEGVEPETAVVIFVGNSDQCRYREGICDNGVCTYSDWIIKKCQPLDVFIFSGTGCP